MWMIYTAAVVASIWDGLQNSTFVRLIIGVLVGMLMIGCLITVTLPHAVLDDRSLLGVIFWTAVCIFGLTFNHVVKKRFQQLSPEYQLQESQKRDDEATQGFLASFKRARSAGQSTEAILATLPHPDHAIRQLTKAGLISQDLTSLPVRVQANIMNTMTVSADWTCPACGSEESDMTCKSCGQARFTFEWDCPHCEFSHNREPYCTICGYKLSSDGLDTLMRAKRGGY